MRIAGSAASRYSAELEKTVQFVESEEEMELVDALQDLLVDRLADQSLSVNNVLV